MTIGSMKAFDGTDPDILNDRRPPTAATQMLADDDLTRGPVWDCECGTVLQALGANHEEGDTICGGCTRRYRHGLIGDRVWRVVLVPPQRHASTED